ncbi:MAG: ABC transporter ATP-binding protein [Desulfococcaceae bacterium]
MISLDGVSYAYPYRADDAVTDLRLRVRPGEAVLCTGPSGCGKSTLVRLVNGLCPHFFQGRLRGRVRVNGRDNGERRLGEIARDVGTLFQDPEQQFFALSVSDEIAFAHEWRETDPAAIRRRVSDALDRFGLNHRANASIHALSEGEKQKAALAAVMSLAPRALVLDEPSANLDPEAAADLAEEIGRLKSAGMAILIVDHRLYWLAGVADRAVILDRGRVAEEIPFSRLADPGLRTRRGLRADRADVRDRLCPARGGPNDLQVADLRFAYPRSPALFEGISFTLPRGRITGVFGPNGAGKTTLARLLTGLSPMDCGRLFLDGEAATPRELLRRASIVLQNADHQLHMKTVRREAISAAHSLPPIRRAVAADEILRLFGLEELAHRHPQSLSGGEKQRLVIACGMVKCPDILILDEPTSGLDGRNMRRIALAMRRAADQGACVLLISHDLELIAESCDGALHLPLAPAADREPGARRMETDLSTPGEKGFETLETEACDV